MKLSKLEIPTLWQHQHVVSSNENSVIKHAAVWVDSELSAGKLQIFLWPVHCSSFPVNVTDTDLIVSRHQPVKEYCAVLLHSFHRAALYIRAHSMPPLETASLNELSVTHTHTHTHTHTTPKSLTYCFLLCGGTKTITYRVTLLYLHIHTNMYVL